jgi:hypothetical protein
MNNTYEHDSQQQAYHTVHEPDSTPNNSQWKQHLTAANTWQRAIFLVIFLVIYFLLRFAVAGIALFQFGALLLTGQVNSRLQQFSHSLCTYCYQLASYLTFTSDHKPFPFSPWPSD